MYHNRKGQTRVEIKETSTLQEIKGGHHPNTQYWHRLRREEKSMQNEKRGEQKANAFDETIIQQQRMKVRTTANNSNEKQPNASKQIPPIL